MERVTVVVVVGFCRSASDYPYEAPHPVVEMLGTVRSGDYVVVAMGPSMSTVFGMALAVGPVPCPIPTRAIRELTDSTIDKLDEFVIVWPPTRAN